MLNRETMLSHKERVKEKKKRETDREGETACDARKRRGAAASLPDRKKGGYGPRCQAEKTVTRFSEERQEKKELSALKKDAAETCTRKDLSTKECRGKSPLAKKKEKGAIERLKADGKQAGHGPERKGVNEGRRVRY